MSDSSDLKIDQDVTPENTVVEDKVYKVVVGIESKPPLSCLKEDIFAQFEEEHLQFVDDG